MVLQTWYTVEQAAAYMQVSENYVRACAARGDLKATKLGKGWRFRVEWLDAFVEGSD